MLALSPDLKSTKGHGNNTKAGKADPILNATIQGEDAKRKRSTADCGVKQFSIRVYFHRNRSSVYSVTEQLQSRMQNITRKWKSKRPAPR
jgi:hypothetical protein